MASFQSTERDKMSKKNMVKLAWILPVLAIFLTAGCEEQILSPNIPETPWSFIVTGDSRSDGATNGVNIRILTEIAAEIAASDAEFVLMPGDLVNGYEDPETMEIQFETWHKIMKPVYDAGIGVYPIRGNHDLGDPEGIATWNKFFDYLPDNGPKDEQNVTYSFTHKNVLIIGLDQYIKERRVNQSWLNGQLSANRNPHIFVFGHEPAFKADHEDCLDNYPDARDRFWASITKAGARTYFCGHDHFFNHARADDDGDQTNDVHQYIVGTAGAPLYDWAPPYDGDNGDYAVKNIYHAKKHGYVLVEIDGLFVTVTWMQRSGRGKYQAADIWRYTADSVKTP